MKEINNLRVARAADLGTYLQESRMGVEGAPHNRAELMALPPREPRGRLSRAFDYTSIAGLTWWAFGLTWSALGVVAGILVVSILIEVFVDEEMRLERPRPPGD